MWILALVAVAVLIVVMLFVCECPGDDTLRRLMIDLGLDEPEDDEKVEPVIPPWLKKWFWWAYGWLFFRHWHLCWCRMTWRAYDLRGPGQTWRRIPCYSWYHRLKDWIHKDPRALRTRKFAYWVYSWTDHPVTSTHCGHCGWDGDVDDTNYVEVSGGRSYEGDYYSHGWLTCPRCGTKSRYDF